MPLPNRFYLDSVHQRSGTRWFTLVIKDSTTFFVEQFDDSIFKFLTGRMRTIRPAEFPNHSINGRSLADLVDNKLREVAARPLGACLNAE